jgi:hypothetical protein
MVTPDFSSLISGLTLPDSLGAFLDGLDLFLGYVEDGLDGEVFGVSIPLIGKSLQGGAEIVGSFRETVLARLRALTTQTDQAVRQVLFEALGPAGVNLLLDRDGDLDVDLEDVQVVADANRIQFNIRLGRQPSVLSVPLAFDMGIPGLGIEVDGNVQTKLGWSFDLGLGVSRASGFYFDTSALDELKVDLEVTAPGLSATGRLAFLELEVTDDPSAPTRFAGRFTVDLKDPNADDNRLTFAEIGSGPAFRQVIGATLTAVADVNLNLVVSFGGSTAFPRLLAGFNLDWVFANASTATSAGSFGGVPTVAFNQVRLDIGSFLSNFLKPVIEGIKNILAPIDPVLKILNQALPVLSDLGPLRNLLDTNRDGKVTLLELAAQLSGDIGKIANFVEAVAEISNLVNLLGSLSTSGPGVFFNLGSFNLGTVDVRKVADLASVVPNVTAGPGAMPDGDSQEGKLITRLESMPGGGLSLPFLDSPSKVFGLFFGKNVDLITYDMPALELGFSYLSPTIPIIGPLGVFLTGTVSAKIDFAFGYDTAGLKLFKDSKNPRDLLQGLYVSDRANADGTGEDVAEVVLSMGIEAFGGVDIVIAKAGVGGGGWSIPSRDPAPQGSRKGMGV